MRNFRKAGSVESVLAEFPALEPLTAEAESYWHNEGAKETENERGVGYLQVYHSLRAAEFLTAGQEAPLGKKSVYLNSLSSQDEILLILQRIAPNQFLLYHSLRAAEFLTAGQEAPLPPLRFVTKRAKESVKNYSKERPHLLSLRHTHLTPCLYMLLPC